MFGSRNLNGVFPSKNPHVVNQFFSSSSDIVMENVEDESGEKSSTTRTRTSSNGQSEQSSPSRRSRPQSEEGQVSISPEMPSSSSSKSSKASKVCRVCGDHAKSFHFGGLSCDSCKAFFRRSVQHEGYANFQCSYDNGCAINMSTRKSCQKCRFEKCLSIGMEKNWVMTDDERTALNQQRLERKQQVEVGHQSSVEVNIERSTDETVTYSEGGEADYIPNVEKITEFLNEAEQNCIKDVVEYYRKSYSEIPYRVPESTDGPRNSLQIVDMFTTILRRFAYFSKLVPEFRDLNRDDQGNLLRASVLEMCLLRGALSFDVQNHRWPNTNLEMLKHCPQLKVADMEKLVSHELYELHMNFIHRMQKLKVDEPTVMLLLLVVLFYPERSVVQDVDKVNQAQEKYLILLEKYLGWRYGPKKGQKLYPHLLTKLTDLRQLNDLHTEYNLKLGKSEVEIIRKGLGELQLNPYPQWNIVQVQGSDKSGSDSLETVGSPEFPPQPVESHSPPAASFPRRSNPMADAFLRRIPALIDDPFAPLISDSEMQIAKARFEAMMSGRDPTSMDQHQGPTPCEGHIGQSHTTTGQSPTSHFPISSLIESHQNPQEFGGFSDISEQMNPKQPQGIGAFENIGGFGQQTDFFRQIRDNLSPEMRAQLGALVGNRYESMSIPAGLDLSKIPPELISSFLGGMGQQQQLQRSGQGTEAGTSPERSGTGSPSSGGEWLSSGGGTTGNSSSGEQYQSQSLDQKGHLTEGMPSAEDFTWN